MSPDDGRLAQGDIVDLLTEVGAELAARGIRGDMFLVGGAAMALAYDTRRSTRDLDAVFEPKATIYEVAALVADRHDLPPDWINDGVKGLLPGPDEHALDVLDVPGLRVSVASARYLLALKVAAARVDRDADDIRALAGICGLTSATAVLDLALEVIGLQRPMLPRRRAVRRGDPATRAHTSAPAEEQPPAQLGPIRAGSSVQYLVESMFPEPPS